MNLNICLHLFVKRSKFNYFELMNIILINFFLKTAKVRNISSKKVVKFRKNNTF